MGKEGLTIVAGSCMLDPEDGMRMCHDVRVHSKQLTVETSTLVEMTKVSWCVHLYLHILVGSLFFVEI